MSKTYSICFYSLLRETFLVDTNQSRELMAGVFHLLTSGGKLAVMTWRHLHVQNSDMLWNC